MEASGVTVTMDTNSTSTASPVKPKVNVAVYNLRFELAHPDE